MIYLMQKVPRHFFIKVNFRPASSEYSLEKFYVIEGRSLNSNAGRREINRLGIHFSIHTQYPYQRSQRVILKTPNRLTKLNKIQIKSKAFCIDRFHIAVTNREVANTLANDKSLGIPPDSPKFRAW